MQLVDWPEHNLPKNSFLFFEDKCLPQTRSSYAICQHHLHLFLYLNLCLANWRDLWPKAIAKWWIIEEKGTHQQKTIQKVYLPPHNFVEQRNHDPSSF